MYRIGLCIDLFYLEKSSHYLIFYPALPLSGIDRSYPVTVKARDAYFTPAGVRRFGTPLRTHHPTPTSLSHTTTLHLPKYVAIPQPHHHPSPIVHHHPTPAAFTYRTSPTLRALTPSVGQLDAYTACSEMIQEYEKTHGFHFDLIVR